MYERYAERNAYRLEQTAGLGEAGFEHCRQAAEEIVIPARWIAAWLGAVVAIIAALAGIIIWLA